mgnify:CR=1 FL=1
MEEGYIKFHLQWTKAPSPPTAALRRLLTCRDEMYRLGLIGAYDNGIGYGNFSIRWDNDGRFIITGTATGHMPRLMPRHCTLVTDYDLEKNTVLCSGPVAASSESMSHAVIYRHCGEVGSVVHVHHDELWRKLLHKVPTTNASATYGSPEMALEIIRLLDETDLRQQRIFVMEGHPEGIFAFGATPREAVDRVLVCLGKSMP